MPHLSFMPTSEAGAREEGGGEDTALTNPLVLRPPPVT